MSTNTNLNLSLPLPKKTVLNVLRTQNYIHEKLNEILKAHEISSEQYNVLRILRGQKGDPANMCLIQEHMIAKTSNTTRLVDKLLAKNLVTREVCPNNRRKIEVSITSKGLDLLEEVDPKILSHEQAIAANMTEDELTQLNLLLDKYRSTEQ
ncbi:MAG TPA: MarR family transcriptional regulator [Flavobacterium sp.]|jgi:DNA-binding MarR family transcriptional regulator